MNTAKSDMGAVGTQTASLAFGGVGSPREIAINEIFDYEHDDNDIEEEQKKLIEKNVLISMRNELVKNIKTCLDTLFREVRPTDILYAIKINLIYGR